MTKQTIIWTALPKAAIPASGSVRLSVHVAPRLVPSVSDKLAEFPDFLAWPSTPISWSVSFGGGPPLPATVVTDPAPRLDVWQAVFPSSTFVAGRPKADTLAGFVFRSYPVANILAFLQNVYTQAAVTSPGEHLPFNTINTLFGPIGFAGGDGEKKRQALIGQLDSQLGSAARANTFGPPSGSGAQPIDVVALRRFHLKPNTKYLDQPLPLPQIDFHQLVSLAGGHAGLLRLLGLVIDLEVGTRNVQPGLTDVRVIPTWQSQLNTRTNPTTSIDVTPRTRCQLGVGSFFAAPDPVDPEQQNGHLPLGDGTRFTVAQVDPDGGGLRASIFADNFQRSKLMKSADTPTTFSLPALRSGGLSVARANGASRFAGKLDRATKLDGEMLAAASGGPAPFISAEDVTRGYYIDVWDDKSGKWHSLTRRTGKYLFFDKLAGIDVPPGDEAAVTAAPTKPTQPAPVDAKAYYLQESLFHWKGWSLAASQPGKHILTGDGFGTPPPPPKPPAALNFDYRPEPGSLPRLRFGVTYAVRMRYSDLAGNSVPFELAAAHDDPNLAAGVTFGRFEPVQSPVLVLRYPRTEGESVERVVLRSNFDADPDPNAHEGERHVAPTKTGVRQAEQHGLFDTAGPTSPMDKAAYATIVAREGKTFLDIGTPDPNTPPNPKTSFEGSIIVPSALLKVPYLPEPLSRSAAFLGLPGTAPGEVKTYPFSGAWPAYSSFRIVCVQAANPLGPAGPPVFVETSTERKLIVELAKADVVTVRLSSAMSAPDLPSLGVWQWVLKHFGGSPPASATAGAANGQNWLLTPYRLLTLVHAVRQPLKTPELPLVAPSRVLGDTFAFLRGNIDFSRKSTGKVDLHALWTEQVDNGPGTPDPFTRTVKATVFDVPVAHEGTPIPSDSTLKFEGRHEFGDTKYRSVTYSAIATTRFAEYFQQRNQTTVPAARPVEWPVAPGELVPGSVTIRDTTTGKAYEEHVAFEVTPGPPGKITFLPIPAAPGDKAGIPAGTKVEAEYLTTPLTRETAAPVTEAIPNAARPAAPKVLYAVPTFSWSSPPARGAQQSVRTGTGFRVYLDRPWWSSGDGELLGVVLWPSANKPDPPDPVVPYVTAWGLDPLFQGASLPTRRPSLAAFTLSPPSAHGTGLSLDELTPAGALVDVAGHAVAFDSDRKLWYCDIDLEAGKAYMPFVRLALARYQPHSLPNAHLSRVVLADFVQLTPDRTFTVVFSPLNARKLSVTLAGPSYQKTTAKFGPGYAQVTIERRQAGVDSDLGWQQVGNVIPLIAAVGPGLWQRDLTLPVARPGTKFRLVVEQFEELQTGGTNAKPVLGRRLVYSDIVSLA